MEKRKIFKTIFNSLILGGFIFVAIASSSSNKSYKEAYDDGYELGRAIRNVLSEQNNPSGVSPDSIYTVSVKDYAMK